MKTHLLIAAVLMAASAAQAKSTDAKKEGHGYLAIGYGINYNSDIYNNAETSLLPTVHGAYYFSNGLFVEFPGRAEKFDPALALGYQFYKTENWEFDALLSTAHGRINYRFGGTRYELNTSSYLGVRATGNVFGLQIRTIVAPKVINSDYSDGRYASLWISKPWQYKNWHFYSAVGAQYRNSAMLDYYYGGAPFKGYEAKGGANLGVKLGFSRALTENWIVDGHVSYTKYASGIMDSPITKAIVNFNDRIEHGESIGLSLSYVF
ncbi:MipA/OmpV family protein [Pseudoalteromonas piscicida]|uniref:MipA/OmpV family protein n=1 Tax=Pseudoalteromonas piscicida TaxID=43662 RepID=UPI00273A1786|nr:MipA/OmpV family protein [Pseudoalteromonas piscicida]MDP4489209.1 MipA/OmpV family protein [Pseudoalteromonas piscicida]